MRRLIRIDGVVWDCREVGSTVDGRAVVRCDSVLCTVRAEAPDDWESAWSDEMLARAIAAHRV